MTLIYIYGNDRSVEIATNMVNVSTRRSLCHLQLEGHRGRTNGSAWMRYPPSICWAGAGRQAWDDRLAG